MTLTALGTPPGDDAAEGDGPKAPLQGARNKPTGRRDLRKAPLEKVRLEIPDPRFEQLVTDGKAERIGHEESCKLAWQRRRLRRLVVARVKYRAVDAQGQATIGTAPMPAESFARSLAASWLLAHILTEKYRDGLPLHRIEDRFARDGSPSTEARCAGGSRTRGRRRERR